MQVDEIIEFTNAAGVTYRFRGLVAVEGLGDVGAEVQTQSAPFQDGSTYIDALLTPRHVSVEFIIRGLDYADVRRQRAEVGQAFNPKLGLGTLRYISGSTTREISAVAESVPFYPDGDNRGERWQRGTLSLVCPNPYWRSATISEMPTFEPLFQFPFEGPFQMGIRRDRRIIMNDGDAATPMYIEFFGPALHPIITNTVTGEFLKVNQELREGEVMRIDTSDGNKSVVFIGVDGTERDVFNWIDLNSTFLKLDVGENILAYSAEDVIGTAVVNISYNKLYNAV